MISKYEENQRINRGQFNLGSDLIGTGGEDGVVRVYDIKRRVQFQIQKQGGEINGLDWRQDDILASGNAQGELFLNQVRLEQGGQPSQPLSRFDADSAVQCVRFYNAKSHHLLAGLQSGHIECYDINRAQSLFTLGHDQLDLARKSESSVNAIVFSKYREDFMMSVSTDGFIRFYDYKLKKKVKHLQLDESLISADFHSNGHTIAVGTTQGNLILYDLRIDKSLNTTNHLVF